LITADAGGSNGAKTRLWKWELQRFADRTDLSAESVTTAGITQTTVFTATFKGRQITALLGSSYSDVNRGDWIAQIEDDGNMQLAISFGHAATELNCSVGDTLFVHPPPR
jgi:S-adenosylmethionine hydrolase